tara:strand:+ start:164 stop:877 length:714 start_codon:yes stop_codon:yes gene_type:complete
MKLEKEERKGVRFWHRPGYSDLKTFEEVIERNTYEKRGLRIVSGEHWMDCGGNVGAFALLACSKGASVTVYEPDPFNCELIEKNLKLNGYKQQASVVQAALVSDSRKEARLFIGNNNNVWRNSIVKKWNKLSCAVPCVNFDREADKHNFSGCKMDIEGAEMPILEETESTFDKLVYEWSFDIDPSLKRLWAVIEKQQKTYEVKAAWGTIKFNKRDYDTWQKSWFPACTNVHCFKREL